MYVLIAFLIAIALFAMIAGYIRNKNIQKKIDRGELDKFPEPEEVDEECCGQHSICEKDSLLAAVSKEVVYYDDEELDQFIGYTPDDYDNREADMLGEFFVKYVKRFAGIRRHMLILLLLRV